MFSRILVALDSSNRAEFILDAAIEMALLSNGSIHCVHVLPAHHQPQVVPAWRQSEQMEDDPGTYWHSLSSYDRQKEQRCHWRLKRLVRRAQLAGVHADYVQRIGDPCRALCEQASGWNADVIVLGRRGWSGLSEMILGSVSNYIIHHVPCAVYLVHPPESVSTPIH